MAAGPVVLLGDIAPFAKKGHRFCRGTGLVRQIVKGRVNDVPCPCAMKRFAKKNGHRLEEHAGIVHWKVDRAP